jgi:asparagine N-glycosylation enzyme membrane subunit Stt3
MHPFSSRYSIFNFLISSTTGSSLVILLIVGVHLLLFNTALKNRLNFQFLHKIPPQVFSFVISLVIGLIAATSLFGFSFITNNVNQVVNNLITPVTSRLGVTVAENKQPFFSEWADNFGPVLQGIPIFFWLFFIGSVFLFYNMLHHFKKRERWTLTLSYLIFLLCLIFSRYKPDSMLNGTSGTSLFTYALGFIVLLGTFGFYYYKEHKNKEDEKFKTIDAGIILLFAFFFFSIVSARGAVRVIMVLVPPASIMASYLIVMATVKARESKEETRKLFAWIIAAVIILAALYSANYLYKASKSTAETYVPNEYTHQWQYAMQWVRENTPPDAVFGHWWDYGYWLQSIGDRATVLDGGNAIEYWDYLMGRYGLTSPDETQTLEFLYAHNTTHFLIDSSDIGKYGAFSSIGSDENYDRASWISSFIKDQGQIKETKNGTMYLYTGGTSLDADIIYDSNGTKILLPSGKAGIGAVTLELNANGSLLSQPLGVFVYQNKRYDLPLRYAYANNKFIDFGSGIESGIYLFPQLIQDSRGTHIDNSGALLYLSNRTVKSQLARLYLYKEDSPYFKLVHSEDDIVINELRKNNIQPPSDIIFLGGVRGPIRIWEVSYPKNITFKPEYLETSYPNTELRTSR